MSSPPFQIESIPLSAPWSDGPESGDRLWRVCREPYADLSGIGASLASGRWHSKKEEARALYCAADPSTAVLEVLVRHLTSISLAPPDLVLVTIAIDESRIPADGRARVRVEGTTEWTEDVSPTRAVGDAWLSVDRGVFLAVPSALVPSPAVNVLVNAKAAAANRCLSVASVQRLTPKIVRSLAALNSR